MSPKQPKPPSDLSKDAQALWRRIAAEVELDEPALLLLRTLCQQYDRIHEAREILGRDGIITIDRFGQQKAHPACGIERDAVAGLTRCWRLLGFDLAPPTEGI